MLLEYAEKHLRKKGKNLQLCENMKGKHEDGDKVTQTAGEHSEEPCPLACALGCNFSPSSGRSRAGHM